MTFLSEKAVISVHVCSTVSLSVLMCVFVGVPERINERKENEERHEKSLTFVQINSNLVVHNHFK